MCKGICAEQAVAISYFNLDPYVIFSPVMKTLITGGAGFIGSHLAEKLLKAGHQVTVLDDLSTGTLQNIECFAADNNFRFVRGSVLNRLDVDDAIQGCDQIYHLAAAVGVQFVVKNPLTSLRINIQGTEQILEAANVLKKPLFLASTSEIYGKNETLPLSEDDDRVLGPVKISRWGYSTSKSVDEFLALAYHREKGLPVVIGRFFNTIGPGQRGEYGMVVPRFINAALNSEPLCIYGDGRQTRCFCHVDDVTEAVIRLMQNPDNFGEVFNIGSDQMISILELARMIIRLTGSRSKLEFVDFQNVFGPDFEEMNVRQPDLTKIKKAIGYKPSYRLETALTDIIRSIRNST